MLLLLAVCVGSACAQDGPEYAGHADSACSILRAVGNDFSDAYDDAGECLTAPVKWSGGQWLQITAAAGTTVAAIALDPIVRNALARTHGGLHETVSSIGHNYGDNRYAVLFGGAVYLTGLATGNPAIRETGVVTIESLVLAGVLTSALKIVTGRGRPYMKGGEWDFHGFRIDNDVTSFPSGHATVAFALSTALASQIRILPVTILLYGIAATTVYQRVAADQHWFSDVLAGAAIGTVSAAFISGLHERRSAGRTGVAIAPDIRNGSTGLCIRIGL
jgi:membrane-associated phospholipid phosphatase